MSEKVAEDKANTDSTPLEGEIVEGKRSREQDEIVEGKRSREQDEIVEGKRSRKQGEKLEGKRSRKRSKSKRGAAPTPAKGSRWLVITSYASLPITPAANFLRYGAGGVRRFGPNAPAEANPQEECIAVQVRLKPAASDNIMQFDELCLRLPDPGDLEGTNIWAGSLEDDHLYLAWVWDFYRLFSGMRLAVELPPEKARPASAWQAACKAMQSLKAGDQIILEATSKAGAILQVFPVDSESFHTEEFEP